MATSKPELNILFASNPTGLIGLAAAGASVLHHKSDRYQYVITTMELDISDEEKEKIEGSWQDIDPEVRVRWVPVERERLRQFRYMGGDNLTYGRLYLAEAFDCERLLYLDIDVVATTNVEKVFETDLQGKALGAVFQEGEDFFNAGVLLFDVNKWKEQNVQDQLVEILLKKPNYHDQDALNHVFPVGTWTPLGATWNLCNTTTPGSILHYRTHIKPWESLDEKFNLFYYYLDMTRYQGWRPEKTVVRKNRSAFAGFYNRVKWKLMSMVNQ